MEKLLKELTGLREEVDSKTGSLGVLGCFIQICGIYMRITGKIMEANAVVAKNC